MSQLKSKEEKELQQLEKEYNKIMEGAQYQSMPFSQTPQWANPNDFIIKFSLYQETPNSITSTETIINLEI